MTIPFLIVLNITLGVALWVVARRAKARIREEKAATYAGVLGAISDSLAREPLDAQIEQLAKALANLRAGMMEPSELKWRLARATWLRAHRHPIAADLLGEAGHAFMAGWVKSTPELVAIGDELSDRPPGPAGAREFNQRHGDAQIAAAQYVVEADIVAAYVRTLDDDSVKLFRRTP